MGVRSILAVWREISVFPALFANGLEALLSAPVNEDANTNASSEPDGRLRAKLMRWFSAADQVRLPSACRIRGLGGKSLSTAACMARLCHFDRFWHRPGVELPKETDLFGDN